MTFAEPRLRHGDRQHRRDAGDAGAGHRLDDRARRLGLPDLAHLRRRGRRASRPVRRAGIPAMQVLRRIDARTEAFPFASLDYETGGRLATEHLLGLGLRRIAFVGGLENRPVTEERMAGYRAVMAEAGPRDGRLPRPAVARLRPRHGARPSRRPPGDRGRRSASPTSSRSACSRASRRPACGSAPTSGSSASTTSRNAR